MHSHLATNPPLDAALLRHQHRATPKARIVCRANGKPPEPGEGKEKDKDKLKSKFALNIDPVNLGRKSRQLFDDVWNQFAKITSPTSSFSEDQLGEFADSTLDYQTPQANFTTVLVLGSTGTVGTVMVRKLLLRGYIVKVMVRNEEAAKAELPPAVEIFQGDLTSYKDCQQSVQGVDKIIYAATSRSLEVEDSQSIELEGVSRMTQAFQDYKNSKAQTKGSQSSTRKKSFADFGREGEIENFTIQALGEDSESPLTVREVEGETMWMRDTDSAQVILSDSGNLLFKGDVLAPGSIAEVGRSLDEGETIGGCEGIIMRVLGDGHTYSFVLTSKTTGKKFGSRFTTRRGFSTVRLPFDTFRPENNKDPPLTLEEVGAFGIRFRNLGPSSSNRLLPNIFKLEVDWIKGLPSGPESDFILVSCAGQPRTNVSDNVLDALIKYKRAGEQRVRNSGLGYTIVRATNLIREPGGYKALVFDQGDRLSEGISAADVADICVRSLHQPLARNKTFEVSQETTPEGGLEMYELVAHIPDRSTNYLSAAMQTLEKNT